MNCGRRCRPANQALKYHFFGGGFGPWRGGSETM
jgi:hypothetical protein